MVFQADIFYEVQKKYCELAAKHVATGNVQIQYLDRLAIRE